MSKYTREEYVPYGMLPENIKKFEENIIEKNPGGILDNKKYPIIFRSLGDLFKTDMKSYELLEALNLWLTPDMTHLSFYTFMFLRNIDFKEANNDYESDAVLNSVPSSMDFNIIRYIYKVYNKYEDIGVFRRFIRFVVKFYSTSPDLEKYGYGPINTWWILPIAEYIARENITKLAFRISELDNMVKFINEEILHDEAYRMIFEEYQDLSKSPGIFYRLRLYRDSGDFTRTISRSVRGLYRKHLRLHLIDPKNIK